MKGWEGLDEFVAVAECGRFSAAALHLGLSSSQVSRQIARLEDEALPRGFGILGTETMRDCLQACKLCE